MSNVIRQNDSSGEARVAGPPAAPPVGHSRRHALPPKSVCVHFLLGNCDDRWLMAIDDQPSAIVITLKIVNTLSLSIYMTRGFDFSLIWAWINRWANNCGAGDLRRHRFHYDVIVMAFFTNIAVFTCTRGKHRSAINTVGYTLLLYKQYPRKRYKMIYGVVLHNMCFSHNKLHIHTVNGFADVNLNARIFWNVGVIRNCFISTVYPT